MATEIESSMAKKTNSTPKRERAVRKTKQLTRCEAQRQVRREAEIERVRQLIIATPDRYTNEVNRQRIAAAYSQRIDSPLENTTGLFARRVIRQHFEEDR
jgi:hypothetical protein